MNKITTHTQEFTYSKNRILKVKFLDNVEITLSDVIQGEEIARELTKGEKYFVLVDAQANVTISKEARAYAAKKKDNDRRIAEAYVVNSVANKLLGYFYLNFNKPAIPTRLYSNEAEALKWFDSLVYLVEMETQTVSNKAYN